MTDLSMKLKDLFKSNLDKTELTIYPNITSLIIDEITLIIQLVVRNVQGFNLNEKVPIKVKGNLNQFQLITPSPVSIFAFDGY